MPATTLKPKTTTRARRAPRDPNTTRSGLRKLNPRLLIQQGRLQASEDLAAAAIAAPERPRGDDSEFYRSAAAKDAWMALLAQASRMVEAADEEIEGLRTRRDAAMLSLFFYGGKRGVDQAAGLSPTTWYEMRSKALDVKDMGGLTRQDREQIARQRGVEEVPDAEQVIADVAPKVLTLTGYREGAFAEQKRAALYLHGILGATEPEIREVTGRSEDTLWQWRYQEAELRRRAAKKGGEEAATTTQTTRRKTTRRKTTLDDVARFAHVSRRDVEAALKDPGSVTSATLTVIYEAAREVGFNMATGRSHRSTGFVNGTRGGTS